MEIEKVEEVTFLTAKMSLSQAKEIHAFLQNQLDIEKLEEDFNGLGYKKMNGVVELFYELESELYG